MCADLGIIGSAETAPDLETLRPEITATRSGNTVKIARGWGGHAKFLDACDIMVDRATGTYAPLVTDTTPNDTDSAPQPASQAILKNTKPSTASMTSWKVSGARRFLLLWEDNSGYKIATLARVCAEPASILTQSTTQNRVYAIQPIFEMAYAESGQETAR